MQAARDVLELAGVPIGGARPAPAALPSADEMRRAVHEGVAQPGSFPTEALLAWLCGFQHHWPGTFERMLGDDGREAIGVLGARAFDRNKYLKLRRIAIANLARCL